MMPADFDLSELFADASYVREVQEQLRDYARNPTTRTVANNMFSVLMQTDLHRLRGSPDEWFNLATSAAQCRNYAAEQKILEMAIELYPDDVDLRCSLFQVCYGHGHVDDAVRVRAELDSLGTDKTGPSWRYWCYCATFEAQYLNNKEAAERLLDEALSKVPPAGLLNIYRHYRLVLIDGAIRPSLATDPKMTDYGMLMERVEQKFREGLSKGIEAGYVLAVDLARLLREKSTGVGAQQADEVLDESLRLLDIAERAYTDDGNHPIWDIYLEKAMALMAKRLYADALQIFRSLPSYRMGEAMMIMAQYAASMSGEDFKPSDARSAQPDGGEYAVRIAQLEAETRQLRSALGGASDMPVSDER